MYKIIAVDFDGTLCENAWPGIGEPKQATINYIREQEKQGAKLILWTNRTGDKLEEALAWCENHGILFHAVNENLPEVVEMFGGDCRKVFANEYIDDRAIPMPGETVDLLSEMSRSVYCIREHLDKSEILAQLAEECAELTQAALKYRRALDGNNPTPVGEQKAVMHLIEEIADVDLCVSLLTTPEDDQQKLMIERAKLLRWEERLRNND